MDGAKRKKENRSQGAKRKKTLCAQERRKWNDFGNNKEKERGRRKEERVMGEEERNEKVKMGGKARLRRRKK